MQKEIIEVWGSRNGRLYTIDQGEVSRRENFSLQEYNTKDDFFLAEYTSRDEAQGLIKRIYTLVKQIKDDHTAQSGVPEELLEGLPVPKEGCLLIYTGKDCGLLSMNNGDVALVLYGPDAVSLLYYEVFVAGPQPQGELNPYLRRPNYAAEDLHRSWGIMSSQYESTQQT